jgi:hypothetical protein
MNKCPLGVIWTAADDALLRDFCTSPITDAEIGELMGRTWKSIATRRRTLGIKRSADHRSQINAGIAARRDAAFAAASEAATWSKDFRMLVTHQVTSSGAIRDRATGRVFRVRYADDPAAVTDTHGRWMPARPDVVSGCSSSAGW